VARPARRAGLCAYGFVATLQPDPHFGRILAAYSGVIVAGSLACGIAFDGFPVGVGQDVPESVGAHRPARSIIQAIAPIIATHPRAGSNAAIPAPVASSTAPATISTAQTTRCQDFICRSLLCVQ
jgi:hypothetical protein